MTADQFMWLSEEEQQKHLEAMSLDELEQFNSELESLCKRYSELAAKVKADVERARAMQNQ